MHGGGEQEQICPNLVPNIVLWMPNFFYPKCPNLPSQMPEFYWFPKFGGRDCSSPSQSTLTARRNAYFWKSPVLSRTAILIIKVIICINFSMSKKISGRVQYLAGPQKLLLTAWHPWDISGVARKISRGGKTFQGGAKISKSKIFRPKKPFHEFHETCHSATFIVIVNSHQRWKQKRNRICFHLWCELTLALWFHSIVWESFFSWNKM